MGGFISLIKKKNKSLHPPELVGKELNVTSGAARFPRRKNEFNRMI